MIDRINLWLAVLGVVAYLLQPVMISHEYHKAQPILSHVIFNN